jgi:hypothetical protein
MRFAAIVRPHARADAKRVRTLVVLQTDGAICYLVAGVLANWLPAPFGRARGGF